MLNVPGNDFGPKSPAGMDHGCLGTDGMTAGAGTAGAGTAGAGAGSAGIAGTGRAAAAAAVGVAGAFRLHHAFFPILNTAYRASVTAPEITPMAT